MAQNLSGGLIRPTLQSEKKIFGGKKNGKSLFSAPCNCTMLIKSNVLTGNYQGALCAEFFLYGNQFNKIHPNVRK